MTTNHRAPAPCPNAAQARLRMKLSLDRWHLETGTCEPRGSRTRSKRYSEEFKCDAVEPARSSDRTVSEVARELGISPESLRNWVKHDRRAETDTSSGHSTETISAAEREELRRRRKLATEQAKMPEVDTCRPQPDFRRTA
ncbi:transposase [Nonomuraea sp. NPDC050394]|uniref:transposase n=1 Tax=Nonomuraea sp. NPDC050394 TaxID=3364363 RepID=UPI0037B2BBA6